MKHHPAAHINPHMGHRAGAVIGSREKDNVAGLCLGGGEVLPFFMGRPRLVLFRSGWGFLKPFECSENGVDRLGLFRIGKCYLFDSQ